LLTKFTAPVVGHLELVVHADRVELADGAKPRQRAVAIDFLVGPTGYRRVATRGKRELIARAVGDRARHRRVVDGTAGLARDAFLLASLGYEVTAIERSSVLAAMVQDALARATTAGDACLRDIVGRLRVVHAEAAEFLSGLRAEAEPDVVYLDPMYETAQGSALAKKEMRVLRMLVGNDADAADVLHMARTKAKRRVVVKRHRQAPPLGEGVSHQIVGTRVRYDVYMTAGQPESP
jgi:16S rRNA (guanine1516-N2)-methyltransferase